MLTTTITTKPYLTDNYFNVCLEYKQKYGEKTTVFVQVGDFYEMYQQVMDDETYKGENLDIIHDILDIKIGVKKNKTYNCLMAGVPLSAVKKHIDILLKFNYSVVIFDQDEEDCQKRNFSYFFSPSVNFNEQIKEGNYLIVLIIESAMSLKNNKTICVGMCAIDIHLSNVYFFETYDVKTFLLDIVNFYNNYNSNELMVYEKKSKKFEEFKKCNLHYNKIHYLDSIDSKYEKTSYQENTLKSIYKNIEVNSLNLISPTIEYLGLNKNPYALIALMIGFDYIKNHCGNLSLLENFKIPSQINKNECLFLGNNAQEQLMITSKNTDYKINSVNQLLNNCNTAMGYRYLKDRLLRPYIDKKIINEIYEKTDIVLSYKKTDIILSHKNDFLKNVRNHLKNTCDIEKILRKIVIKYIEPDDLYKIYDSLKKYKIVFEIIKESKLKKKYTLNNLKKKIDEILNLIDTKFNVEMLKDCTFDKVEKSFYNKNIYNDIDDLEEKQNNNSNNMELLLGELNKLDPGLKITLCKTKKNDSYFFKTSLKNGVKLQNLLEKTSIELKIENFTYAINIKHFEFEKLKSNMKFIYIEKNLTLNESSLKLKQDLKKKLFKSFKKDTSDLYFENEKTFTNIITNIINIDYIFNNAHNSMKYHYSKPILIDNEESVIYAKQIRHPIIEQIIEDEYITQDIALDEKMNGYLIYGVNSSGKSSLMKAIGINLIMAQCGLYCACSSFQYSIFTSLYTRISGSDNLHKGKSSFVIEMDELHEILKNNNKNCLVLGDEICRGTEPMSAVSIVGSTLCSLLNNSSKFIFATHLHELMNLELIKNLKKINICHLNITFNRDEIIFDRTLTEGSGKSIYGIEIARYIINNNTAFFETANDILKTLCKINNYQMDDKKTSNYNNNLFMKECELCKSNINLETHHIHEQKNFIDGIDPDNLHIKKNGLYNVSTLCKVCHDKITYQNDMSITKKISTSKGLKII
jgi:DNA mismatch repair protein MutS